MVVDKNKPIFSIFIPTWNSLSYLKLCVDSIRKNSMYQHEIIVHVNEGTDGTLEWVKAQNIKYTYSVKNIGVCLSMNLMRTKMTTSYVCFINDDMYVCPGWDEVLIKEIEKMPDNNWFLSGTIIQKSKTGNIGVLSGYDYGNSPDNFQEEKLLLEYATLPHKDWFGATMPPNVVHRDLWDMVGGYSIELTPGMYSDPDFTAKLWMVGVRYLKGLTASRVYHFEARSTGRVKKNRGNIQFLFKWGITSSSFRKNITKKGEYWDESQIMTIHKNKLKKNLIRSKLKRILYVFKTGAVYKLWE